MRTPLLLALVLFVCAPALPAGASKGAVAVCEDSRKLLASLGWKAQTDGGLVRLDAADKRHVPAGVLENALFVWKNGALTYDKAFLPVESDKLGPILRGLAIFAEAADMDEKQVGKAIAGWGIPPSYDGRPILNPDGEATYYGLMLYQFYVKNPAALKLLSQERLMEALERLSDAHEQAFEKQAPDVAADELEVVWSVLAGPARPGEQSLDLKPYPDLGATLAKYRGLLKADQYHVLAGPEQKRQTAQALAVLDTLKKQRYASDLSIAPPPDSSDEPDKKAVPLTGGMPVLLAALDRVNGKPLTPDQQENLIKSFPMGELVWRLGVQNLWRQGLTGKGVKVAIVDGGVAPHPELDGAVKGRQNFTADRGAQLVDSHGTHVAGIVHQIAPDAELRSYVAFQNEDPNKKLSVSTDDSVVEAVKKAVADGNHIVNLSLSAANPPSDKLSRLVDEYAKKGVIFMVAAGNDRGGGVHAPSNAPGAFSVGSLTTNGRMSDFSQFGSNYDPVKLKYVIKDVFMLPGDEIRSTVPDGFDTKSGTSMAAPAGSGVNALLLESVMKQAAAFRVAPDPLTASRRIKDALTASSAPMDLRSLPPGVPMRQNFLVVDPMAALRALQAQGAPATATK